MALTEFYVTSAGSGGTITGAGTGTATSSGTPASWAAMVTAINAGYAGNRYNVSGAVALAAASALSGSGSLTSPIIIRGYNGTIGNGYLGRTNGNGALISTNMPAVTYSGSTSYLHITGSNIFVESLNIAWNVTAPLVFIGPQGVIRSCIVNNASTNASAAALGDQVSSVALDNDLILSGASGGLATYDCEHSGSVAIGNRIVGGGTAPGVYHSSNGKIINNTIYGSPSHGINVASTSSVIDIIGNTIVGNAADGIHVVSGLTSLCHIIGNVITDNGGGSGGSGGYGINGVSAANAVVSAHNRLDRNGSGNYNLSTDTLLATEYMDIITSVSQGLEFVAYASQDFRLLSTSPAVAAGIPAYRDIGALQRAAAAGGGIPNLIGDGGGLIV